MNITSECRNRETSTHNSGVHTNPHGGYTIHVKRKDRAPLILDNAKMVDELAPTDAPTLAGIVVFEDCIILALEGGKSILLHVSDPRIQGTVLRIYHANCDLWRAVGVEALNPGWVMGQYQFRGDLEKFDQRQTRIRGRAARPAHYRRPTFWATGGWSKAVVYTSTSLTWRIAEWQHSPLTTPQVATPDAGQVEALERYPADVQMLLTLEAEGVEKVTYQFGGLALVLTYVERIGLAAAVDRHCQRNGDISEGMVMTALVINRLLAPCSLHQVAEWVKRTGLHLLLGIPDPELLNYDRLADTLQAVAVHWSSIAAEVTLNAVEQFGLTVETVHYDLTSVCFCGQYEGSSWVEFGYSRDHRPDLRQINIGLSTTADGEVVLPGGSGIHPGSTNDATTTLPNYQKLQKMFERSDILVTGDRIMQSAGNMLSIARAHGRFLGPVDWTPKLRRVVADCAEDEFQELPASSARRGYSIKAVSRQIRFKYKEPLSDAARERVKKWRKKRRIHGRCPKYRTVNFWMRAAVILDTRRQAADAQRRERTLRAYEAKLAYTVNHLGKGRYYGDPEWVIHHLADLESHYKTVRNLLRVTFRHTDDQMELTYHRRPERIAAAAKLDGKWVLVTNQPRDVAQSIPDYLDWMVTVYHNHRHVERRMRNLKSDLPIRPLYVHRDDEIVALCFASLLSLTIYTLIERDVQTDPQLAAQGLRTTDAVLIVLSGWGLAAFLTPSGFEHFWFDTPSPLQQLISERLRSINPGTRLPRTRQTGSGADLTMPDALPAPHRPSDTISDYPLHLDFCYLFGFLCNC